ncbi:MAG: YmdB family metallophosphoesterase [Oscillospiraceae bacterium]|nr:YmdB family metallophosphoesterase [Oscillospiraceae bacterium]
MQLRILAIGDVTGQGGVDMVSRHMSALRRKYNIDFAVVNGENADTIGARPHQIEQLFYSGADVVTLGNHTFGKKDLIPMIEDDKRLLRPSNYSRYAPGSGWGIYDVGGISVLVMSLIGRVFMDVGPENPFLEADRVLKNHSADIKLIDFHAEATSEKLALAYYLDGRISALWGTHTHVQTSDECVLPGGTGYITDLGVTGPQVSVLGVVPEQSINRFLGKPAVKYTNAQGPCKLEGAVFTVDALSGKCTGAERVRICD